MKVECMTIQLNTQRRNRWQRNMAVTLRAGYAFWHRHCFTKGGALALVSDTKHIVMLVLQMAQPLLENLKHWAASYLDCNYCMPFSLRGNATKFQWFSMCIDIYRNISSTLNDGAYNVSTRHELHHAIWIERSLYFTLHLCQSSSSAYGTTGVNLVQL